MNENFNHSTVVNSDGNSLKDLKLKIYIDDALLH